MTPAIGRVTTALSRRYCLERDGQGGASLFGQGGMARLVVAQATATDRPPGPTKSFRAALAANNANDAVGTHD